MDQTLRPLGLREHVRRTITLALPVMLGRTGIFLVLLVDSIMTGHAGPAELAHYAVASAAQTPMLLLGIGLMTGTVVLTAQCHGAGEEQTCGHVWRVALMQAAVTGIALAFVCLGGETILRLTGQPPALVDGASPVLAVLGWGLPGMLLFTATTLFLEGLGRATPGMLVMVAANVLNLALNWVLIFGHLGAPALGAEGAALATTIVRWFMFAALAGYVLARLDRGRFGLRGPLRDVRGLDRRLRRIGLPMGIAHCFESAGFSAMTMFAGWLGATVVAAYTVAMNLIALAFMGAIGLGTAASVRVGNAIGRGDGAGVATAGWVAVGLSAVLMSAIALTYFTFPEPFAAVYGGDPELLVMAVPTVAMAAFVLVPDAWQGVCMGALRGMGDVWPATGLYLLSFWGFMVPAGYLLGVHLEGGAVGLTQGVAVGTLVAAVAMTARFRVVSRRTISRI